MEINTDLIDKGWEYFFVPHEEPLEIKEEGRFRTMTKAILNGILMVRTPTALNLIPTVFEQEFKEGVDYHVKNYDDMTIEVVEKAALENIPVYVFYPTSLEVDFVIQDALERRLILPKGEGVDHYRVPFDVKSEPGTIEQFKERIGEWWKKQGMTRMENPLNPNKAK